MSKFIEKLLKMKITIHIWCMDARELVKHLDKQEKFDRIDVSNIVDINYVGLEKVLQDWGPMLKKNEFSTLITTFMNWHFRDLEYNLKASHFSDPLLYAHYHDTTPDFENFLKVLVYTIK